MTELLAQEIERIQLLVQAAVVLMATVMVIGVWARTKAIVPTAGAIVFGALVVWAVHNVAFLQGKIGEEFESSSQAITAPVLESGDDHG